MSIFKNHETFEVLGVKLEVPHSLLAAPIRKALLNGSYESAEGSILEGLIQEGDVILEIGAGLGLISTIAARSPKTSRVIAVEADPQLIPTIRRTHEINNVDVAVYNEMLGASEGTHDFFVSEHFWASSAKGDFGGTRIQIPIRSFQERLREWKPSFLIVDIEGGEVDIFEGIDMAGVQKVQLEVHQNIVGRQGMKKLFDTLSAQGFHYDQWHSSHNVVTFSHIDRI
jgi:FkbM family methyltransferase